MDAMLVKLYSLRKHFITAPSSYLGGMLKRPGTRETIARNLQMLMDRSDPPIKQPALAKKAGVAQKTISNMLNPSAPGVSSNTLDTVEQVAKAFGLTAWHLLMPTLPDDIRECQRISDLVDDYLITSQESRKVILHTAERERRLAGNDK